MANGPDIDDLTVRPGAFTERGTETDPDVKEAKPLMTEFTDLENTEKALELLREKKSSLMKSHNFEKQISLAVKEKS